MGVFLAASDAVVNQTDEVSVWLLFRYQLGLPVVAGREWKERKITGRKVRVES